MPEGASRARAAVEGPVLGFDFGSRRIGVAIGNRLTGGARPLAVLDAAAARRWPAIVRLIGEWQPAQLVVGIPRHPDGAPHAMTAACERFARQLAGRHGLPVTGVDERYSTAVLAPGQDADDAAAALILQQWLDTESKSMSKSESESESAGAALRGGGRGAARADACDDACGDAFGDEMPA